MWLAEKRNLTGSGWTAPIPKLKISGLFGRARKMEGIKEREDRKKVEGR
jgi:hypothetical protein